MHDHRVPSPYSLRISDSECHQLLQYDKDPILPNTALISPSDEDLSELKAVYQTEILKEAQITSRSCPQPVLHCHSNVNSSSGISKGTAKLQKNDRTDPSPTVVPIGHRISEPDIVQWLSQNFERHSGCSVARSEMYHSYVQFCQHARQHECNQALFGKTIRVVFPGLSTRRIGVRGKSKYHYYGLRPKATSPFFHIMNHSYRRSLRLNSSENFTMKQIQPKPAVFTSHPCQHDITEDQHCLTIDLLTSMIPDFPDINTVTLPENIINEAAQLLTRYRKYAEDLLTGFRNMDLAQVASVVSQFWQDLPATLTALLDVPEIQELVFSCDGHIYQTVAQLILPSLVHQQTAESSSTIEAMQTVFVEVFPALMSEALIPCPDSLKENKLRGVRRLTSSILRGLDLSRQLSDLQEMLKDTTNLKLLKRDLPRLNLAQIITHSLVVCGDTDCQPLSDRIETGFSEFLQMIDEVQEVESYLSWLENFMSTSILEDTHRCGLSVQDTARQALLHFSYIIEVINRELTCLNSAMAFGCFHRFEMALKDYMLYWMEMNIPNLYADLDTKC